MPAHQQQIATQGFTMLRGVFDDCEVTSLIAGLDLAMRKGEADQGPIRDRSGTVYAGRNILSLFEAARSVWRKPELLELLDEVLGGEFGLVRALYFDKPPERTWSLPWHKDMTLAVKAHPSPSTVFSKPTLKAGVPHVEGSLEVLQAMLTLRIHLDDVTDENGPLQVMPASHLTGKAATVPDDTAQSILCRRGDVLAIRPLVSHRSISSKVGTERHRRILHLEFSVQRTLPDGFEWFEFVAG